MDASIADLARMYADQANSPSTLPLSNASPSGIGFRLLPQSQNIDDRRGKLSLADLVFQFQHWLDPMGSRFPEVHTFPGRSDYGEDISATTDRFRLERKLNDMQDRERNRGIFAAYEANPSAASDLAAPMTLPLRRR